MFDLGKQRIVVKCSCGRNHNATLKDASNKKKINCGCGTTIQLGDSGGSVRRGINNINKSVSDLEKMFKKLGK